MFRAPICERDWRPSSVLHRSSFVVVVSGQWCCTHCDTRDNRRLVAIKTAFARLTKSCRTSMFLEGGNEIIKLHPISILFMPNLLNANSAEPSSISIGARRVPPPRA